MRVFGCPCELGCGPSRRVPEDEVRQRIPFDDLAEHTGIMIAQLAAARNDLDRRGLIATNPDGRVRIMYGRFGHLQTQPGRNPAATRETNRRAWREWVQTTETVDEVERALLLDADDRDGFVDFAGLAARVDVDESELFDALDRLEDARLGEFVLHALRAQGNATVDVVLDSA